MKIIRFFSLFWFNTYCYCSMCMDFNICVPYTKSFTHLWPELTSKSNNEHTHTHAHTQIHTQKQQPNLTFMKGPFSWDPTSSSRWLNGISIETIRQSLFTSSFSSDYYFYTLRLVWLKCRHFNQSSDWSRKLCFYIWTLSVCVCFCDKTIYYTYIYALQTYMNIVSNRIKQSNPLTLNTIMQ